MPRRKPSRGQLLPQPPARPTSKPKTSRPSSGGSSSQPHLHEIEEVQANPLCKLLPRPQLAALLLRKRRQWLQGDAYLRKAGPRRHHQAAGRVGPAQRQHIAGVAVADKPCRRGGATAVSGGGGRAGAIQGSTLSPALPAIIQVQAAAAAAAAAAP